MLGQKRQGIYCLFRGKLSVTALLVHHFFPRSNYSRFHLVTLLCSPWCTIIVIYNRTEIQGPGVKAGKNCCWNVASAGFVFVCFFYIVDLHSAASSEIRSCFAFQFLQNLVSWLVLY